MVQHLTTDDFKLKVFNYEVGEDWKFLGDKPAIIDFYADWCGPCKLVAPILEKLSTKYEGQIDIYKVDTEQEQMLAAVFGIRSIPSILFIPKDKKPMMQVGVLPEPTFIDIIEKELLNKPQIIIAN